jgi:hypothetical protein
VSVVIKILVKICRELGLPDWAALLIVVPILLFVAIGAVLIRRKYFQILKRKIKPYNGTLRHGLFFWAPTAYFEVDGIPGELPWVSIFGVTQVRFPRLPAAGRIAIDTRPFSEGERRAFKGEPVAVEEKIFAVRFHVMAAPGPFGAAFLDAETRRRLLKLFQMSREVLGRGEDSTPKGRMRLEIDGKAMRLELKGQLGTPEIEALLDTSAALVRRVLETRP